jgi:hypothetical protein
LIHRRILLHIVLVGTVLLPDRISKEGQSRGLALTVTSIAVLLVAIVTLFTPFYLSIAAAWDNWSIHAPRLGVARVRRARVLVIAVGGLAANAFAQCACVRSGTCITIIAARNVVCVNATGERVAVIIGAHVIVFTINGRPSAFAVATRIITRAGTRIIAIDFVESVQAADAFSARIAGTDIAVRAIENRPGLTGSVQTLVIERTHIAITARGCVERRAATGHGVAEIVGTRVRIVAVFWVTPQAEPSCTGSTGSTHIAIVTLGAIVWDEGAA